MRRIVLYIVYGHDQGYYDGAKFSLITFMNWISNNDLIEIVILSENPEAFKNLPVTVIPITKLQINEWSLNGKYHFRIKNRGLAFAMDVLKVKNSDKILFLDTDTYFKKSPLELFDLIQPKQALFYLNEGLIYDRKRFNVYVESLRNKQIKIDDKIYELKKDSEMWGSLMIGIMPNMRTSLELSDKLLLKFIDIVPAHTIEPFALVEILKRKCKIVEGKRFVSLYSTSRKKEYAVKIISKFFVDNKSSSFESLINKAQKIKIKRSIYTVVKQRFIRLVNKNVKN